MALNNDERERLKQELAMIENDIQRVINREGPSDNLEASSEDLPAIQNAVVHDYDEELNEIEQESQEIVDNLVGMYLDDDANLINHDYIRKKRQKDADNFARLDFLVKSSQRIMVNVMREIDMGATTPKMFEVISMLQREMRENIKLSSTNLTNIEKFYKEMRKDLGLQDEPEIAQTVQHDEKKEGHITSHLDLNKRIDDILKRRKNEEDKDKIDKNESDLKHETPKD